MVTIPASHSRNFAELHNYSHLDVCFIFLFPLYASLVQQINIYDIKEDIKAGQQWHSVENVFLISMHKKVSGRKL